MKAFGIDPYRSKKDGSCEMPVPMSRSSHTTPIIATYTPREGVHPFVQLTASCAANYERTDPRSRHEFQRETNLVPEIAVPKR